MAFTPDRKKLLVLRDDGAKALVRPDQVVAIRPVVHQRPAWRRSR
jgi:hypothetical protein